MKKWQRGMLGVLSSWLIVAVVLLFAYCMAEYPEIAAWMTSGMILAGVGGMGWTWATMDDDET